MFLLKKTLMCMKEETVNTQGRAQNPPISSKMVQSRQQQEVSLLH